MDKPAPKRRSRLSYLLLLVPYVAMLWVPFYNRAMPEIAGIPFFYWYQMLWIVLGALILLPAYYSATRGDGQ
jgi:Protein of unknown function (DUF3311)